MGAVELFEEHNAEELVREGRFGHGQAKVGAGGHGRGKPKRAADDEHEALAGGLDAVDH